MARSAASRPAYYTAVICRRHKTRSPRQMRCWPQPGSAPLPPKPFFPTAYWLPKKAYLLLLAHYDVRTYPLADELLGDLGLLHVAADADDAKGVLPRARVLDVDAALRLLHTQGHKKKISVLFSMHRPQESVFPPLFIRNLSSDRNCRESCEDTECVEAVLRGCMWHDGGEETCLSDVVDGAWT